MLRRYLVRGLKAGLVAGVAFGLFVALVASPMIGAAERLAGEHGHGHGEHADESHAETDTGFATPLPSALGGVFWGLLLGVVTFGLAFYVLEPAIPGTGAIRSAVAGGAGFVTVSGAPWLVLPPQPPGVEGALATDVRLGLYAGMMLAGFAACLLAGDVYARLRDGGRALALAGAAVSFGPLVGLAVVLPVAGPTQTVPAAFAAAFRAQVLFGQALVWSVLVGTHAWLSRRGADSPVDSTTDATSTDGHPTAD